MTGTFVPPSSMTADSPEWSLGSRCRRKKGLLLLHGCKTVAEDFVIKKWSTHPIVSVLFFVLHVNEPSDTVCDLKDSFTSQSFSSASISTQKSDVLLATVYPVHFIGNFIRRRHVFLRILWTWHMYRWPEQCNRFLWEQQSGVYSHVILLMYVIRIHYALRSLCLGI